MYIYTHIYIYIYTYSMYIYIYIQIWDVCPLLHFTFYVCIYIYTHTWDHNTIEREAFIKILGIIVRYPFLGALFYLYNIIYIYTIDVWKFSKLWLPQMDGVDWTILLEWMIWGYLNSRKPPNTYLYVIYIYIYVCIQTSSRSQEWRLPFPQAAQAIIYSKQFGEQPVDIILLVGSPLTSDETASNSHKPMKFP